MPSSTPLTVVRSFYETELLKSGILLDEMSAHAFIPLNAAQTCVALGHSRSPFPSVLIPYFNPDGTPLIKHGRQVLRVKLDLPKPSPTTKKSTTFTLIPGSKKGKKADEPAKYGQPDGLGPEPYFSPNIDWTTVLSNPLIKIIFVEGEKKAFKLCQDGHTAIGVGGVWNWCSRQHGEFLLEALTPPNVNWEGRRVEICWDSDYDNKNKKGDSVQALIDLAEELNRLDADVYYIELPKSVPGVPAGDKIGADDFLVHRSNDEFIKLREEALPVGYYQGIQALRPRYAMIKSISRVVDVWTCKLFKRDDFVRSVEPDQIYRETTRGQDGKLKQEKKISAAAKLIEHPFMQRYHALTYVPGGARVVRNLDYPDRELYDLNTWLGLGVEAVEGDCQPMLDLVEYLMTGTEPHQAKWFDQAIACPLARLGTKLNSAIFLHSTEHGVGKSALHKSLAGIYGRRNVSIVSQDNLESQFNGGWAFAKMLIVSDELDGSDSKKLMNKMKTYVSEDRRSYQFKGVDPFDADDYANHIYTSNAPNALWMEKFDRRFFIHEIVAPKRSQEFYDRFWAWFYSPGGLSAWLYHLQNNIDLTGFNPGAQPPMTEAKMRMIQASMSYAEQFLQDLIDSPDSIAPGDPAELITFDRISDLSKDGSGRPLHTSKSLSIAASKMNLPCITNKSGARRQVVLADGLQKYLLIKGNAGKWTSKYWKDSEINEYLAAFKKPGAKF